MSEKKQPTYAANNKQIARALGLKPNRKVLAQIGEWRVRPDFPKKAKGSWFSVAELREWHAGQKPEVRSQRPEVRPPPSLDETEAERERAIIQQYRDGKAIERFSEDQRLVLVKHGYLKNGSQRSEAGGQNGFVLAEKVTTLRAIAPILNQYYKGKLLYEISPQNISDWRHNNNQPNPDAPVPPCKEGNYFILAQWIEWFDRWVLPHWSVALAAQPDLFVGGDLARLRHDDTREDLLHRKFLREVDKSMYVRRSILGPLAQGISQKISAELTAAERVLPQGLAADLADLAVPEALREPLLQKFAARCRAWNDALQAGIPARLKQLAEERAEETK